MESPLPIRGQFRALGLMLLHMLLSPWRLNMSQILAITDRDQEPKVLQNALKLLKKGLLPHHVRLPEGGVAEEQLEVEGCPAEGLW